MGKPVQGSLRQRCLDAVLGGATTMAEVLAVVGRTIPAAQAAVACRAVDKKGYHGHGADTRVRKPLQHVRTPQEQAANGRRILVRECLGELAREGKLSRPARGVYGPPVPRLYTPSQAG